MASYLKFNAKLAKNVLKIIWLLTIRKGSLFASRKGMGKLLIILLIFISTFSFKALAGTSSRNSKNCIALLMEANSEPIPEQIPYEYDFDGVGTTSSWPSWVKSQLSQLLEKHQISIEEAVGLKIKSWRVSASDMGFMGGPGRDVEADVFRSITEVEGGQFSRPLSPALLRRLVPGKYAFAQGPLNPVLYIGVDGKKPVEDHVFVTRDANYVQSIGIITIEKVDNKNEITDIRLESGIYMGVPESSIINALIGIWSAGIFPEKLTPL